MFILLRFFASWILTDVGSVNDMLDAHGYTVGPWDIFQWLNEQTTRLTSQKIMDLFRRALHVQTY
jgi:hypothetical protein